MYPISRVSSSENDELLGRISAAIESIDCSEYFSAHLGKGQSEQKILVSEFQKAIFEKLKVEIPCIKWEIEHRPKSNSKDSIDIYGHFESIFIVIELDKHRADQVAKKFVSRLAILPNEKVYFISLCYPGTQKMSKPETLKYFGYCAELARRLGAVYSGFFVESKT